MITLAYSGRWGLAAVALVLSCGGTGRGAADSGAEARPDGGLAEATDAADDATDAGPDASGLDAAGDGGGSDATPSACYQPGAWIGDFDGDGMADCAEPVAGTAGNLSLGFHKGVGAGVYLAASVVTADVLDADYASLAVFDLNHDGRRDIVVAISDRQSPAGQPRSFLQLFRGQADGTFLPFAAPGLGPVAGFFSQPAPPGVGDFDGDGQPDLVSASSIMGIDYDHDWVVMKSTGGLDFTAGDTLGAKSFRGTTAVAGVGDLNHDGKLDIVVLESYYLRPTDYLAVALGNGDGTFGVTTTVAQVENATSVTISDADADGKPDLLVALAAGPTVFYGDGAGNFSTAHP